jgi:hypothetical protein
MTEVAARLNGAPVSMDDLLGYSKLQDLLGRIIVQVNEQSAFSAHLIETVEDRIREIWIPVSDRVAVLEEKSERSTCAMEEELLSRLASLERGADMSVALAERVRALEERTKADAHTTPEEMTLLGERLARLESCTRDLEGRVQDCATVEALELRSKWLRAEIGALRSSQAEGRAAAAAKVDVEPAIWLKQLEFLKAGFHDLRDEVRGQLSSWEREHKRVAEPPPPSANDVARLAEQVRDLRSKLDALTRPDPGALRTTRCLSCSSTISDGIRSKAYRPKTDDSGSLPKFREKPSPVGGGGELTTKSGGYLPVGNPIWQYPHRIAPREHVARGE